MFFRQLLYHHRPFTPPYNSDASRQMTAEQNAWCSNINSSKLFKFPVSSWLKLMEDDSKVTWSAPVQSRVLLQVLQEASVAEVVDVSTEQNQVWVDVIGHTVVGGHGVAKNGRHNEGGGAVADALLAALYQGTKSAHNKHGKVSVYCKNTKCYVFLSRVYLV